MDKKSKHGGGKILKNGLISIVFLMGITCFIVPNQSYATIALTNVDREVSASIYEGTLSDTPAAKTNNSSGSWTDSVTASVTVPCSGFLCFGGSTYYAAASQNSNISLSNDTLTATANGSVRQDSGGNASSYFVIDFGINAGSYKYLFTEYDYGGDNFTYNNSFTPYTSGVIGPGTYELGIRFTDVGAVCSNSFFGCSGGILSGYYYTPYTLSFDLTPNTVPEPGMLLLFCSGLISIVGYSCLCGIKRKVKRI